MPRDYKPVEALLDFFAVPDVGELIEEANDAELIGLYARFLSRLAALRDGRPT